jgi:hypothetical protein
VAEYLIRRAVHGNPQNCETATRYRSVAVVTAGQLLDETFCTKDDNLNTLRGKF